MLTALLASLGVLFLLSRKNQALPPGDEPRDAGGLTQGEREALIQQKAPADPLGLVDQSGFGNAQLGTSAQSVGLVSAGAATVGGLVAGGPVGLAAGVVAMAGGVGGYLITKDTAGAVVGAVMPVQGNVFNAGRMAGLEVDKALGGTGYSATGIVAQASVGVGLVLLMYAGMLVAAAFMIVAAILYPIVAAIEDVTRLAYGQAGAQRDYEKLWAEAYKKATEAFKATFPEKLVGPNALTNNDITRLFTLFVDGYMRRKNRISFATWMNRPRGLTFQSDFDHGRFGADRGLFVGNVAPDGSLIDASVPMLSERPAFQGLIPPEDRIVTVTPAQTVNMGLFKTQMPGYTTVRDALAPRFHEAGEWYANAVAFVEHMASNWGVGQSEMSHAVYGRKAGYFEGDLAKGKFTMECWRGKTLERIEQPREDAVRLTWKGKTAYWRNMKGEPAMSIAHVPTPDLVAATEAAKAPVVQPRVIENTPLGTVRVGGSGGATLPAQTTYTANLPISAGAANMIANVFSSDTVAARAKKAGF